MTRKAPRAISMENYKKNNFRTALLEMRTALLETRSTKAMRVYDDRTQNFAVFNVIN